MPWSLLAPGLDDPLLDMENLETAPEAQEKVLLVHLLL